MTDFQSFRNAVLEDDDLQENEEILRTAEAMAKIGKGLG
jgi:hypothetical protein